MPRKIFPDVDFGEKSVYPTNIDNLEGTIGVPYVHGWFKKYVSKPIEDLRKFGERKEDIENRERRKKREVGPPPKPELRYKTGMPELPPGYKIRGEGMGEFYERMSARIGGVPIYEVPGSYIDSMVGNKDDGRYVAGLCETDAKGRKTIFISGTDEKRRALPRANREAATYHEAEHAKGVASEYHAQARAALSAIRDKNLPASEVLIKMLINDRDYFCS